VNDELANMWKEAAVASLNAMICHVSVGSRQRHEYTSGCLTVVINFDVLLTVHLSIILVN